MRYGLVAIGFVAGCSRPADRASMDQATDTRAVELTGIAALPAMRIVAPRFVRESSLDGVERVMYWLTGGSASKGLMANVMIGLDPRSGAAPRMRSLPRCLGTERTERQRGLVVVTCEDPDERRVAVTHPRPAGDIVCMASWKAYVPLDEAHARVTRAIDAACLELTFRP